MKVSIIIPVYNVEPYVERCLQSVMSQTYKDSLECLIVDDCGTDRSVDVVERIVEAYHGSIRFKIIHHERNRGLSAARNTGMAAAMGDYLFFLDSDDEISVDCIERLSATLKEEQYDVVVGDILTIGDDVLRRKLSLKLADGTILRGKEIENTYRKDWNMIAPNKLYRSDFIRKQGLHFKEGLIHEDELWSLQVACLAQSLRAVNSPTYIYYVREGSLTTSAGVDERRCMMLKVICTEICKFLKKRKIFSARAYMLMQKFFWLSFKQSLFDKSQFIKEYCSLRKQCMMPMSYRIRACGPHPRAQLQNLYYLIPAYLAAKIIYWRNKK